MTADTLVAAAGGRGRWRCYQADHLSTGANGRQSRAVGRPRPVAWPSVMQPPTFRPALWQW